MPKMDLEPRGQGNRLIGWVLVILGGISAFVGTQSGSGGGQDVILFGIGLLLFFFGFRSLMRGRRLGQKTVEEIIDVDPRPPIVFLRAFSSEPKGLDDIFGFTIRYQLLPTHFGLYQGGEGQRKFAADMNMLGPFIALGRPGEDLPAFGASRKYVPDGEWQSTILDWISRAAMVVIWARPPKEKGGFDWELEQLVRHVEPNRILIICPGRKSEYRRFKAIADATLPQPLPEKPPKTWLLTFDRDWTPRPIPPSLDPDRIDVVWTLKPMLDDLGLESIRP